MDHSTKIEDSEEKKQELKKGGILTNKIITILLWVLFVGVLGLLCISGPLIYSLEINP